ncbi:MAG: threonine/serine exporter family protein [Defluviitaleaceae bacterium]|nr:threonine/serine exporter family protein [Defluviitaleaceae bacterium]
MVTHFVLAFFATTGFCLVFNVPRREFAFCGMVGALGWIVYQLALLATGGGIVSVFFAAMAIAYLSRVLSFWRKMPINLFMIPGVIPLVPGVGIYYTMLYTISGENAAALMRGIETLMVAGVISIGLLIVLSLPRGLFGGRRK